MMPVERQLLRMCTTQAALLDDYLNPVEPFALDEEYVTHSARLFIGYAALLARTQARLLAAAENGTIMESESVRDMFTGLIKVARDGGGNIRRAIKRRLKAAATVAVGHGVGGNGQTPPGGLPAAEVDEALQSLEHTLARQGGWFREPTRVAVAASAARGEGLEVDDAFAQMKGMTREQWLAHVEEHKRRHHGGE